MLLGALPSGLSGVLVRSREEKPPFGHPQVGDSSRHPSLHVQRHRRRALSERRAQLSGDGAPSGTTTPDQLAHSALEHLERDPPLHPQGADNEARVPMAHPVASDGDHLLHAALGQCVPSFPWLRHQREALARAGRHAETAADAAITIQHCPGPLLRGQGVGLTSRRTDAALLAVRAV